MVVWVVLEASVTECYILHCFKVLNTNETPLCGTLQMPSCVLHHASQNAHIQQGGVK